MALPIGGLFAQSHLLTGHITDEKGGDLPGTTILELNSRKGAVTDGKGQFELNLNCTTCQVEISGLGFEKQLIKIDFSSSTQQHLGKIVLREDTQVLNELVITESKADQVEQKAFSVTAIDAKPLQIRNMDVNMVLGQVTGVRIREAGGMGSRFTFSLNGLSGRQVKLFIDDIPMDVMGRAFSLNNFPVNLIERVEVYKGVVPVHLGSDALGGSVNILTDQSVQSFLDASYSYGSFNTHRAAFVGRYRFEESGFTVGLKSFFNYSDNNYTMYDMEGYVDKKPVDIDAERYHDAYRSFMTQLEVGYTDTKWADVLMVNAAYADLHNEIQTGYTVKQPFGEAEEYEDDYILSLDYRKSDFGIKNLDVKLFSLYSKFNRTVIDTSSYVYDWEGNREPNINPSWGEALREKSYYEFSQRSFLQRAYLSYDFTPNQKLSFNYITTYIERQGENRYGIPEQQSFASPNKLAKHILGLSHEMNLLHDKLSVIPTLKRYLFNINATDILIYEDNTFEQQSLTTHISNWGYSLALRYYFTDDLYMKGSFERGYRIPEPFEIFGDGLITESNPNLKPEESYNYNLGTYFKLELNDFHSVQLGLGGFYRDVRDYIFEKNNGKVNQFENIEDVVSKGLEIEMGYKWKDKLTINTNLTWQEFINNQETTLVTNRPNPAYGLRIPNTPYLFGNLDATYTFKPLFQKIGLSAYYSFNYVHDFLLAYDLINNPQNEIPAQFIQNAGLTFSGPKQKHSLSLEGRNLFNEVAYDNYKLQKPGRAFYVKWRYFLK
ncbi:hypothetical protein BFP72_06100 [Reichenbachiella sp. 5M10]|nr:hypothetical protein BFP72_06100 [Reichenbachiella sp. 5M10]